jgi:hypothetical protein
VLSNGHTEVIPKQSVFGIADVQTGFPESLYIDFSRFFKYEYAKLTMTTICRLLCKMKQNIGTKWKNSHLENRYVQRVYNNRLVKRTVSFICCKIVMRS